MGTCESEGGDPTACAHEGEQNTRTARASGGTARAWGGGGITLPSLIASHRRGHSVMHAPLATILPVVSSRIRKYEHAWSLPLCGKRRLHGCVSTDSMTCITPACVRNGVFSHPQSPSLPADDDTAREQQKVAACSLPDSVTEPGA